MPTDAEALVLLAAIEAVHATLAVARALVQSGREVDLTGLDAEAGRLCIAIACASPQVGPRLLLPLHDLVAELDRLRGCLEAA